MKNAKVMTIRYEIGRPDVNEICTFIHENVGNDIVLIFLHTNIVLLEDYLVLVDVLEFAKKHCSTAKAYFYGTLNFKHVGLMQAIDSTMGENSTLLIDVNDLSKLKPAYSKLDELIQKTLYDKINELVYRGNKLSKYVLNDEDLLLTKNGCIEMGIIKE